jgi:hypothetical protein
MAFSTLAGVARAILVSLFALIAVAAGSARVQAQEFDAYDQLVSDFVAQYLARSIVISDANLITLGIVDFDPNEFVDLGNINTGDAETLKQRSSLTSYALPWVGKWQTVTDKWRTRAVLRLSYVATKQELAFEDDVQTLNTMRDTTYIGYAENTWEYRVNDHWRANLSLGLDLLHYNNDFTYREEALEALKPLLEGSLFNTSYDAWMLDPGIAISYTGKVYGHKWEYSANYRYAVGRTFNVDSHAQRVSPEVGRLSNSLVLHYDTPDFYNRRSQVRLLARRIDLDADAVEPMGTDHYFEVGAGWLIETKNDISWLQNVGLGLSLNIDSDLSGGSVVILFNESM